MLLGLKEGVDMRTIERGHPNLVTLTRGFGRLPVLDELSARGVVPKARASGIRPKVDKTFYAYRCGTANVRNLN